MGVRSIGSRKELTLRARARERARECAREGAGENARVEEGRGRERANVRDREKERRKFASEEAALLPLGVCRHAVCVFPCVCALA